jgi:hypothetical protein
MTVEQALKRLKDAGVTDSIQTVRRWLREGKIKAHRTENRKAGFVVDVEDLNRFIDERTGRDKDIEIEQLRNEINILKKQRDLYLYFVNNTVTFEETRKPKQRDQSQFDLGEDNFSRKIKRLLFKLNDKLKEKVANHQISLDLAYSIAALDDYVQGKFEDIEFTYEVMKIFQDNLTFINLIAKNKNLTVNQLEQYISIKLQKPKLLFQVEHKYTEKIAEANSTKEIDEILAEFECVNENEGYKNPFEDLYKQLENQNRVNYKEKLGLPSTATNDDIKKEYKKLIKILHPDKGGNAKMLQNIKEEYDTFRASI